MDSAYPELPENPESLEVIRLSSPPLVSNSFVRIILTFLPENEFSLISSTPSSSLAANRGGKTHTGLYGKGDITPAKVPFLLVGIAMTITCR